MHSGVRGLAGTLWNRTAASSRQEGTVGCAEPPACPHTALPWPHSHGSRRQPPACRGWTRRWAPAHLPGPGDTGHLIPPKTGHSAASAAGPQAPSCSGSANGHLHPPEPPARREEKASAAETRSRWRERPQGAWRGRLGHLYEGGPPTVPQLHEDKGGATL